MEIFFYIIIFIMGITFGSFYTLAVYRIPKGQDITHTHSYCPNCNHKLNLFDLIPILSYVFLGGKCKYCKKKIRPRYLILEALSGIFFVVIAFFMGLSVECLSITKLVEYGFFVLYFTFIILIAGIDKEINFIKKSVLIYGIIVSVMYMVYLYIIEKSSIYRYVMYLMLFVMLLLLDNFKFKKYNKGSYTYSLLIVVLVMVIFTGEFITGISIISILGAILLYLIWHKINNKNVDGNFKFIPIAFYLAIFNVVYFLMILGILAL